MQLHKTRLLHLLKNLQIGGVEKSTINYSNILAYKLDFVGIFSNSGSYSKENIINEKVYLFNEIKGNIGLNKYFLLNLLYLIRVIKNNRINVIYYHFRIYLPIIFIVRILFPRLKIVYVAHSAFNDIKNHFLYANKYISVSNPIKKDLIRYGKSDITVIPHGIRLNTGPVEISDKIENIGYIGRFEKNKGIEILLAAFNELSKAGYKINLVFRGEGKERKNIVDYSNKNNLKEKIIIEDPIVSEVDLFKGIDILVFPSTSLEGFGLVVLEAMNYGIPVVSSDFIKDNLLIENDNTGVYFRNGDHLDLTKKLELLIENKNLRHKIKSNARDRIKQKFNLETTIAEYLELLQNI